jgi:Zn-dependent protease with chaperone function
MNFFESQERSYRNTRRLLILMTLAVIAVVTCVTAVVSVTVWMSSVTTASLTLPDWALANWKLIGSIALAVTAFIGFASLYRILSLRSGGSRIAMEMGGIPVGPDTQDPLQKQLVNVVQEMAIASGVPVPDIYVLEHESGINAFAAGFSTADAAVAVTRGTLETLTRDELQGVIAHEFSHIFNGDMRLNIQLMGPLYGILAIGLLGRTLLRGRSRGKGAGAAVALGAGLAVTGYVGLFIGRLIRAGVSRQREYLADASAVQFTRQTDGIAGALKKIGGLTEGSVVQDKDAEEVSHMLFASGLSSLNSAFASHPPLLDRIQALDPEFSARNYEQLQTERINLTDEGPVSSLAETVMYKPRQPDKSLTVNSTDIVASIGHPTDQHILVAQSWLAAMPEKIAAALQSADHTFVMPIVMMLHEFPDKRRKQLTLITQQLGEDSVRNIAHLYTELQKIKYESRLPLLELALPQIKRQPEGRIEYLCQLLEQIALSDNELELFEYAILRIVQSYAQTAAHPSSRHWKNLSNRKMSAAAARLLEIYTHKSNRSADSASKALEKGMRALAMPAPLEVNLPANWSAAADETLTTLRSCTPRGRRKVIEALIAAAAHDGVINIPESELLRAFCAMLGCPVPPVLESGN